MSEFTEKSHSESHSESDSESESESESDTDNTEEYIPIEFTDEEIDQILNILNNLILTNNTRETFTYYDIERITSANKYTNLFFYYALHIGEKIQTSQGKIFGGGIINATIFFILLLLTFNTLMVDAGLLNKKTALYFKSIHHSMSQKKDSVIELSTSVIKLSNKLREYTPPIMKDIVNMSTMTKHTASITQIVVQKQKQKRIYNLSIYILENILLRNINNEIKKKIINFIYICFIKEIVPKFFPKLQLASIQFADIILWCIQNKIPETFKWSKKIKKEIKDFYEMHMLQSITEGQLANYWGGKKSIKQKKRSFIRSKKNIKYRKKNTKITMKKTMMNRMMTPK